MASGFQYFDDSKIAVEDKITALVVRFADRFGRQPTVIYVHKNLEINPEFQKGVALKIIPDKQIYSKNLFGLD